VTTALPAIPTLRPRFGVAATVLMGLAAALAPPRVAHAEVSEKSTHAFEGHVFPPCNRPAATGPESFDAHYTVGREAFEHGDHAEALKQFAMAYEADCKRHEILIIVSRAYEGDHNYADAARVLELYIARVPDAANASSIRERITKLRDKDRARAQEDAKARAAAAQVAPKGEPTKPKAEGESPGGRASPSMGPWIVVGTGGALFVAGGVTLLVAAVGLPAGCNFGFPSHCDNPKDIPEAEKSRPASYVAATMMGVGLVTAGAGIVWHILDKSAASGEAYVAPKLRIVPSFGANHTGISLTGSL